MTEEAKPEETPEQAEAEDVRAFARSAYAAGVASANERNEAQWERVLLRVGHYLGGSERFDTVQRIIDEERAKP